MFFVVFWFGRVFSLRFLFPMNAQFEAHSIQLLVTPKRPGGNDCYMFLKSCSAIIQS